MTMSGKTSYQQVPLTIYHDWTSTIECANKLMALKKNQQPEQFGLSDHYSLKSLGNISEHRPSKSWFRVSSQLVNQTMPWLDQLLENMKELEPDDGAISLLNSDGASHVDLPFIPSALNYIFYSTDPKAYTWIRHNDQLQTHPSTPNSAWIIDTQKEHGIVNTGTRYTLNIHFGVDYSTLKRWFDRQSPLSLTFGSPCGIVE
jgi:hypothetical protein